MKLSVIHRVRHGHWYEPEFIPISDYLGWRVCGVCEHEGAVARHQRTLAAQAAARAAGRPIESYTEIVRSPYGLTRSKQ